MKREGLILSGFMIALFTLAACKKDPVVEDRTPVPPLPIVPECHLQQMVVNPEATHVNERDTIFFDKGLIRQATAPHGIVKYTYQQDKLWKKEQFNQGGELRKLSTYEHNLGAGQLLYERMHHPDNPNVVDSFSQISYLITDHLSSDVVKEVAYYTGNHKLLRRYVLVWNNFLQSVESISVRDSANYPVATYTFTCDETRGNSLRSGFPSSAYLFAVDPSGYADAIRIGLFFSMKEVKKITATVPGFQPLNITYTYNSRNIIKEAMVNGVPMWRFRYSCD
jgi:hypothetical protein